MINLKKDRKPQILNLYSVYLSGTFRQTLVVLLWTPSPPPICKKCYTFIIVSTSFSLIICFEVICQNNCTSNASASEVMQHLEHLPLGTHGYPPLCWAQLIAHCLSPVPQINIRYKCHLALFMLCVHEGIKLLPGIICGWNLV